MLYSYENTLAYTIICWCNFSLWTNISLYPAAMICQMRAFVCLVRGGLWFGSNKSSLQQGETNGFLIREHVYWKTDWLPDAIFSLWIRFFFHRIKSFYLLSWHQRICDLVSFCTIRDFDVTTIYVYWCSQIQTVTDMKYNIC